MYWILSQGPSYNFLYIIETLIFLYWNIFYTGGDALSNVLYLVWCSIYNDKLNIIG